MTDIEQDLKHGHTIICYDCPTEINNGDEYVMKDGRMYCKDCGEEFGDSEVKPK